MTSITKLLGIKYPIFQGAMAQISKYQLAAAVSNAGGLGIIASGGMTKEELRTEIRHCQEATSQPFAVNLMLMAANIPELVAVIVAEGVKVVTTGAGTPKAWMPIFKEHRIKVIPVVPSASIAKKMEELGVTAVIAEGSEAGGHIGELSTMVLVPQVVKSVSIPVLAAGGIGTGRQMAAALALGAQGVQMGTAFMLAEECPIPLNVKEFIKGTNEMDTIVTGRNSGAPVRSIKNKMIQQYIIWEKENMSREKLEELTLGSARRGAAGDIETGSIMAGQVSALLSEIQSCERIIDTVLSEARETINNLKMRV